MRFALLFFCWLLFHSASAFAGLTDDIQTVIGQGRGTDEGRAAWDRVARQGPGALPKILSAMPEDIVASNWLRTAFDRIVDREFEKDKGKGIDFEALLSIAEDRGETGRARELALRVAERLRPGTSRKFYKKMLDDPDFRYEAAKLTLGEAKELLDEGKKKEAKGLFGKVFEFGRDMKQLRAAAEGLEKVGVDVSVGRQMGFLMDWYVVGPFDAKGKRGFELSYPPEKSVDLSAVYEGKDGKIGWRRMEVSETPKSSNSRHQALVKLPQALGNADDAVAFAYTEITVPKGRQVEFRGAGDDNLSVWVNGKKEFGFEEYQNGVRHDRHRFKVKLRPGRNRVLVKVCQAPANMAPNWEFMLRIADATGKGIRFKHALPEAK